MVLIGRLCRRFIVVALLAAAPSALAQQVPPYLLTTAERAALRQAAGGSLDNALESIDGLDAALGRVFRFKAEPYDATIDYYRGLGQSQTRLDHLQHDDTRDGNPSGVAASPVTLEQGRFIGAGVHRCHPSDCDDWGAFVADLKTGHMISAVVDRVVDEGSALQGTLMIFSVACVDRELAKAARPFFERLAEAMLHKSIQWTATAPAGRKPAPLKAKSIVVSCDGKLIKPLPKTPTGAAASPVPSSKRGAYRLSDKVVAALRVSNGKWARELLDDKEIGKPLDDALRSVADRLEHRPGYSFHRLFMEQIVGGEEHAELVDGRFLFAPGCAPSFCGAKAALLVDLVSGHLAMATNIGAPTTDGPWIVIKACANDELKAAASAQLVKWLGSYLDPKAATTTPCP